MAVVAPPLAPEAADPAGAEAPTPSAPPRAAGLPPAGGTDRRDQPDGSPPAPADRAGQLGRPFRDGAFRGPLPDGLDDDDELFADLFASADRSRHPDDGGGNSPGGGAAGGGSLRYGAVGLPPGLAINPSTGAITGTVALGDAAAGPYTVTVSVGDGTSGASQTFTWNVNSPVTITTPADRASTEGDTISLRISATDSAGGTLTYSAVGLPAGLAINPTTGAITGTVAAGAAGTYTVVVTAGDGMYSAGTSFSWSISSPITITDPGEQYAIAGEPIEPVTVKASSPGTLSFYAEDLPLGLEINQSSGEITGTIQMAGEYVSTIRVTNGSYTARVSLTWLAMSLTDGLVSLTVYQQPPTIVQQPKALHLDEVVLANLNKWSTGNLRLTDVNLQVDDFPNNSRGQDAAALVVLKLFVLSDGAEANKLGPYADLFGTVNLQKGLTKANLQEFAKLRAISANDPNANLAAKGQRARFLDKLFQRYVEEAGRLEIPIASTKSVDYLFGGKSIRGVLADSIQQGIIGDCSFLSALFGYVQGTDVNVLKGRIRPVQGVANRRAFEVKLYDTNGKEKWIKVQEPTKSQRIMYGHATDGSLWVTLFELAYLQERINEKADPQKGARLVNGSYFEQAASGESMQTAILRLTGSNQAVQKALKDFPKDLALIAQLPPEGRKSDQIVTASTLPNLPDEALKKGLVPNHAYAVAGYLLTKDRDHRIKLRNPWNDGNIRGGRIVTVDLAQFRLWFNNLATNQLVK